MGQNLKVQLGSSQGFIKFITLLMNVLLVTFSYYIMIDATITAEEYYLVKLFYNSVDKYESDYQSLFCSI